MTLKRSEIWLGVFTMFGIVAGIVALFLFLEGQWFFTGSVLIAFSALIDRYDGRIARRIGAESDFGKHLDASNDLISFILAPMVLLYQMNLMQNRLFNIAVIIIFIGAAVFRLARYAIRENRDTFQGLPSTVAGVILIGFLNLFYFVIPEGAYSDLVIGALIIILASLMVATFRLRKV